MSVIQDVLLHHIPFYGGVLMFFAGLLVGFIVCER